MTKETQEANNCDCFADAGLGTDSPVLAEASDEPMPEEAVTPKAREADFEDYRWRLHKEMDEHEAKARETMLLDFLFLAWNSLSWWPSVEQPGSRLG
jgi:hypothetical protein